MPTPTTIPTTLITGTTGFVGSRVARRLLDQGGRVRAIVRRRGAAPELEHLDYEEIEGDFVDPAIAARAADGCGWVVHAAATSGPEFEPVRRVNVDGTAAMLAAAERTGATRFVHISTLSVYDVADQPVVDESMALKTAETDPYGTTKAMGDRLVMEATGRGLAAVIFRPGAILGVHRTSTWAVKVPTRVRDDQNVPARDGRGTHPTIHVEDLVDAVELGLRDDRAPGGVYNVVSHNGTWGDYLNEVRSWFGLAPMEPKAASAAPPWTGRFANERLLSELAWKPSRSHAEGMGEAAEHWRSVLQRKS